MKRDRLEELLAKFPSRRIAVVGDFFLDKYLEVDPRLAETSVETGKRANQVVEIRTSPGAAGTVVNNLAALGAGQLHAIGATGDDGEAYDLRRGLEARNCSIAGLVPFSFLHTPTYLKPRDVNDPSLEGEHERYDTKNRRSMPAAVGDRVLAELDAAAAPARRLDHCRPGRTDRLRRRHRQSPRGDRRSGSAAREGPFLGRQPHAHPRVSPRDHQAEPIRGGRPRESAAG